MALVTIGIAAIMGGFSALGHNQWKAQEAELMQRLAFDKYDELVGTGALQTDSLNGDFSDRGEDRFLWDATVEPTGVENLSALTITVEPRDDQNDKHTVSGTVYVPPVETAPAGGTP
jgi:hypothetical protein